MMFKKANMGMITMLIIGLIVILIVVSMNSSLFGKTNDSVENTVSISHLQDVLASNDGANSNQEGNGDATSPSTTGGIS